MTALDVPGYLRRIGVDNPGPPSIEALHALHQAHVERVPYETLQIHLGRPTSINPYESAQRIVTDRAGGYCYHLNGAFSLLLRTLGYRVTWHRAGVERHGLVRPPGANANHLGLVVSGLECDIAPDGRWLIDVGLGDALHEPVPLQPGTYVQGPYAFIVRWSDVEVEGWRLDHDPRGGFAGVDFAPGRAARRDFEPMHTELATSPQSSFVRVMTAQRRHGGGADVLRGCILTRVLDGSTESVVVDRHTDWFAALADIFGLTLADVASCERDVLWRRVLAAHLAWETASRP